ncbi:hypothetical protein BGZ63DRAFT_455875 [Mariannaea sp. PMI_226]|nr:hypothetical protein BGZ63DRAFT_455875 [Mariannaea sp. PMI_226]
MTSRPAPPPVSVPGIHHAPTEQDFALCRTIYNQLPEPEDQPQLSDHNLQALGEIIVKHNAQHVFGIHILYSHFPAPEGTVWHGEIIQLPCPPLPYITQTVSAKNLAERQIRGYVFQVVDGVFVPCQFHGGKVPSEATGVGPGFFIDMAEFIHNNNLSRLVGLQLLDSEKPMVEFLVSANGIGMVERIGVLALNIPQICQIPVAWSFHAGNNGSISPKEVEFYVLHRTTSYQKNAFIEIGPALIEKLLQR